MKKTSLLLVLACCLRLLNACSSGTGAGSNGGGGGIATHFSISAFAAAATAGAAFNFTVTALDASNNVVTSYSGTVQFTSSDGQASLPGLSRLTNGTGSFSVTLKTTGSQTISATDAAMASITGSSSAINVTPPTLTITSGAPPSGAVGVNYGPTATQYFMCHWVMNSPPGEWRNPELHSMQPFSWGMRFRFALRKYIHSWPL